MIAYLLAVPCFPHSLRNTDVSSVLGLAQSLGSLPLAASASLKISFHTVLITFFFKYHFDVCFYRVYEYSMLTVHSLGLLMYLHRGLECNDSVPHTLSCLVIQLKLAFLS